MTRRWKGTELCIALALGGLAAVYMPNGFYSDGVSEIVTVLGFIVAALVPAMVLAATAIRAGAFSVLRIRSLASAIDVQIRVFGGLLLYALGACGVAIAGKLLKWTIPAIPVGAAALPQLELGWLFPSALTFTLVFLALRLNAFVAGVLSILRLTATIAEDEARARDRGGDQQAVDELEGYRMPEGYGATIHH